MSKLKPCFGCKREVDQTAKTCPGCGRPNPTISPTRKFAAVITAIAIMGLSGVVCVSVCSDATKAMTTASAATGSTFQQHIERGVAEDAVAQYETAKRSGSKLDACVHAGFAKAAFIQAKDDDGVSKWGAIEKTDCRRAGAPAF